MKIILLLLALVQYQFQIAVKYLYNQRNSFFPFPLLGPSRSDGLQVEPGTMLFVRKVDFDKENKIWFMLVDDMLFEHW